MNGLIKLAILFVIVYTGAQALNTSISNIEDTRDRQQQVISQIKGD